MLRVGGWEKQIGSRRSATHPPHHAVAFSSARTPIPTKWYHLLGQSKTQVRGADWCNADRPLQLTDVKRDGPTLLFAYDQWLHKGGASKLEGKEDTYLALPSLHL
jgi:hypothetical protein